MSGFNLQHWYKGAVAASVAMIGLGAVADDPKIVAFAIGLLLIGLGEWINHPFGSAVVGSAFERYLISGETRNNKPLGVIIVLIGAALCLLALARLAISLF